MNVHHLELFFYVAKFGGISEAVRNMPYGIQQPAVSAQISQLEEYLGVTLFHRRPFALTAHGQELYAFVTPFFSNLSSTADKIRGGIAHHVRIGASEIILREHLPTVIECARQKLPGLRITLREGYQPQLEDWLLRNEVDLAITLIDPKSRSGLQSHSLMPIEPILLVPKSSKIKSAAELWKADRISQPLISIPGNELVVRVFFSELRRLGVDWFIGMEVSSFALVETYVANGYGIGLSVKAPGFKLSPRVRELPLEGFPAVNLGVLWQNQLTPALEACVTEIRNHAVLVERISA
jgi:DNA-binding transcriptional LysR family regulator